MINLLTTNEKNNKKYFSPTAKIVSFTKQDVFLALSTEETQPDFDFFDGRTQGIMMEEQ